MLKFYQVIRGWESYYTLDKNEALEMYNNSGESDKDLVEFSVKLTPALFVNFLNSAGMNLTEFSDPDIFEEKHSWNLGLQ